MDKLISGKLSDDALDRITGGSELGNTAADKDREEGEYLYTVNRMCPKCKMKREFYVYSGGRAHCSICEQRIDA